MRALLPAVVAAALIAATAATAAALPGDILPRGALPGNAFPREALPRDALPRRALPGDARPPGALPGAAQPGAAQPGAAQPGAAQPGGAGYVTPTTTRDQQRGILSWPLSPRPAVHRRFEQPPDRWSRGHRGVDLLASVGQPVLSAGDGVVAFSGVVAGRGVITVRHSAGLRTTYEPVDVRLASGTHLHRGDAIGVISSIAGHCVPLTCLHWGALAGLTYRDPLSLLGVGRPILLPPG